MKDAFIYGLADPRTGLIRYVGKSVDPQERLKSHLSKSKKTDTHCARWIRSLRAVGLGPKLVVLEGPCEDWEEAERRWIALLGSQLTNLTGGGDGPYGLIRTSAHCAKIGLANKRRKYTPEMRANMSKAQKARFARLTDEERQELRQLRSENARRNWDKPMSAEGRANIAAARRGWKDPPEMRAKKSAQRKAYFQTPAGQVRRLQISKQTTGKRNPNYGKTHTPEAVAKIIAANRGKVQTRFSCVACRRELPVNWLSRHLKTCR